MLGEIVSQVEITKKREKEVHFKCSQFLTFQEEKAKVLICIVWVSADDSAPHLFCLGYFERYHLPSAEKTLFLWGKPHIRLSLR